ncbi:type I restriction-modification system subunit M N-terminal domain-containing protein [Mycoplasmopsis alligatoris]|uniref:Conserved domain protein n=1 Tax=Mycoplasmopsis alligatoris A21JP2 TaxID=747682 RepID=D4XVA5_9BACT|nr:type I restriction-modification system subunit M N-terminal domain-containing protein [Mycoplasmopsis alligatoris]EFF41729.1 conserved domain protein [Mycoplasmopsis alligatoris A21JP2]
MNNKKELEQAEIHKTIWAIAEELRGTVDGWDFKQYVLGLLFYRFISENISSYINKIENKNGNTTFDFATTKDKDFESAKETLISEKGFYIKPSHLFKNVVKH